MCVGRRGRRPLQKTAMHVTNPVGASSRLSTRSNRKTIAPGNLRRPPVRCSLNRAVIRFIFRRSLWDCGIRNVWL